MIACYIWSILLLLSGFCSALDRNSVFHQRAPKLVGQDVTGSSLQGQSVALSSDGRTALVGGPGDDSRVGGVWVFVRDVNWTWAQQGTKLVGTGAAGFAQQGYSVALSSEGNTALVGCFNMLDSPDIGAAWVFIRDANGTWIQQGPKLRGTGADTQGLSVALSADGNTALIGTVWVFVRDVNGSWMQQGSGLLLPDSPNPLNLRAALSSDGNTAMVGNPTDNGQRGAAWVFIRDSNGTWVQQGSKLVATGADGPALLGSSVALNSDGNIALIGGYGDNHFIGAAWVFIRDGYGTWTQQGSKLVGRGVIESQTYQGSSVALSSDANTALIGGSTVGALWAFIRNTSGVWIQQGPEVVDTSVVDQSLASSSVALSADGNTALMGVIVDNSSIGAAWVFDASPITQMPTMSPNTFAPSQSPTTLVESLPTFTSATIGPVVGYSVGICLLLGICIACPSFLQKKITGVGQKITIVYGSDVMNVQKLQLYLSHGGSPDLIPPYQQPWSWAKVPPNYFILFWGLVTVIYLASVFAYSLAQSQLCSSANSANDYQCSWGCQFPLKASYGDFLRICGLWDLFLSAIPIFLVPLGIYGSAVLAVGWGARNTLGQTGGERLCLLHFAAVLKQEESIRLLVEHGAYRHFRDSLGRTPLDIAKETNASPAITELLTEEGVTVSDTDVFCSHAWGIDGEMHKVVVGISEHLQSRGIRTWIDNDQLKKGDVARQLAEAIDKTRIFLVFITKAYIEKVAGSNPTDNCKLEFEYGTRTKMDSGAVLPILLDEDVRNTKLWHGPVGFYLGKSFYLDMTGVAEKAASAQKQLMELETRIREMLGSGNESASSDKRTTAVVAAEPVPREESLDVVQSSHVVDGEKHVPNNEQEIRQWLEDNNLQSLADMVIKQGFKNANTLQGLAQLPLADIRHILYLEDGVTTMRLRNALNLLFPLA